MNYNAFNSNPKRVNSGFRHSFFPHLLKDVSNASLPVKNPATSHSTDDRYLQTARPMQITRVRRQNGKMIIANPSLKKKKGSQPLGLGDELLVFEGRLKTPYSNIFVLRRY